MKQSQVPRLILLAIRQRVTRVAAGPGQLWEVSWPRASVFLSPTVLPSFPCVLLRSLPAPLSPSPGSCWPQFLPLSQIMKTTIFVTVFSLSLSLDSFFLFISLPNPITLLLGNHLNVLPVNVCFHMFSQNVYFVWMHIGLIYVNDICCILYSAVHFPYTEVCL